MVHRYSAAGLVTTSRLCRQWPNQFPGLPHRTQERPTTTDSSKFSETEGHRVQPVTFLSPIRSLDRPVCLAMAQCVPSCPAFHFFAEAPFPPWPHSPWRLCSIDKHRDWLDICVTTQMPARPLWSEGPDQATRMPDRLDAFLAWVQPLESTSSPDIAIKVQPGSISHLFSATRDSSAAPWLDVIVTRMFSSLHTPPFQVSHSTLTRLSAEGRTGQGTGVHAYLAVSPPGPGLRR
jgi:hypothetical protein